MILHMGIASATKFDDFAIEKKEADALSASIANVMAQFDWAPDPRFTAIAGLVTTSATIYGPRLYLYREHAKAKAQEKKAAANGADSSGNDMVYTGLTMTPPGFGTPN